MKPTPIGELFAIPLQSAIRAQVLAHQETIATLELLGIDKGQARLFRLRAERTVEERIVDPETGVAETKQTVQPFEITIPLLALLPLQTIKLQEMDVDFGVEVLEIKSEQIASETLAPRARGPSLAGSPAILGTFAQTKEALMKVHMKIVRDTSEGLARTNDLLTDLLSGRPVMNR
jgi:hypothetical protein